jgi:hypothetical protein
MPYKEVKTGHAGFWAYRIPPKPWPDLLEWSKRMPDFSPSMVDLVDHIVEKGLHHRLFAYTSMHDLCVANYPNISRHKDELTISPLGRDRYTLKYFAAPMEPPEFVRQCGGTELVGTFDNFIALVRW